jgi:protein-S-isoprenylcysteine O-methyltransferase Ste14
MRCSGARMNDNACMEQPNRKSDVNRAVLRRLIQVVIQLLIQAAILFVSAGRLDWVMAWAAIGVQVGIMVVNTLVILPKNPELIAERGQIKENVKGWDKLLAVLIIPLALGVWAVAGLDERFGWLPQLAADRARPSAIQVVALVLMALGQGLFSWAMASNEFFSTSVRIQEDRGHAVVTGGPYRYVRHPGYVGYVVFTLATPLILGSLWALIPAGLVALAMIVRTALEDETLLKELDGYKDYATRVRYRLLPGVW